MELPGDKKAQEAALAAARLSLHAKLSGAPSWAARGDGSSDEFRIGAVPSQQLLERPLDLSGLLPEGTPAPPSLSARSQGSARPSAPWHGGWAAASGSAPQSARELLGASSLPGSSLNSALNSARGPASSGIPLAVPLTPAAEAVGLSAPPSQRELLPAGEDPSDGVLGTPASGGGLRRAARRLTHPFN